jgi:hypothetical protein
LEPLVDFSLNWRPDGTLGEKRRPLIRKVGECDVEI